MNRRGAFATIAALALLLGGAGAHAGERFAIEGNASGAERVEVVDVNGDGLPDVVAVGRGVCSWYENPAWTGHLITGVAPIPGLCTSATADLDGDGWAEVVLGSAADPAKGTPAVIRLATRKPGGGGWEVAEVGTVPDLGQIVRYVCGLEVLHNRVRYAMPPATRPPAGRWAPYHSFVMTPGPKAGLSGSLNFSPYRTPPSTPPLGAGTGGGTTGGGVGVNPRTGLPYQDHSLPPILGRWVGRLTSAKISGPWARFGDVEVLAEWPFPEDRPRILTASDQGVTLNVLPSESYPHQGPPRGGDSDVDFQGPPRIVDVVIPPRPGHAFESARAGRTGDGRAWVGVVEQFEGRRGVFVVDVTPERPRAEPRERPGRVALGASPAAPRALWAGDIDGDDTDEVVAGDVGPGGKRLIRFDLRGDAWMSTVLDPDIDARDLRGGDLDCDGRQDLVAVDAPGRITGYRGR